MKTFNLVALAALAVILSACCACRRGGNSLPLIDTPWKLAQLYGAPVVGSNAESFTFTLHAEGKVSGVGDCNRYSGTFRHTAANKTGGKLSMGSDMISTRMMCPGQEFETRYLGMLREVDSYSIDGARLLLIKGGDVVAIFDHMTEPVVSTQPIDQPRVIQN